MELDGTCCPCNRQIGANCDKWHLAFDCRLRQEIIFCIVTHVLPADNPQQSETCSYIGLKGNQFCRHCDAGGTDKHKETKGGYEAMYSVSTFLHFGQDSRLEI